MLLSWWSRARAGGDLLGHGTLEIAETRIDGAAVLEDLVDGGAGQQAARGRGCRAPTAS